MHIVQVDLTAPGITFKLTPHAAPGTTIRETVRQTTANFISQEQAQVGINTHFFNPFPSSDTTAYLAGLSISQGNPVSAFDNQPASAEFPGTIQNYAIVPYAPALNLDALNHPSIVHRNPAFADNLHVLENVTLYNALSGSAQIITNGVITIPQYQDASHPAGLLTPNATYSNSHSWYELLNARTAIGYTQNEKTLVLFTVDAAGGSLGMTGAEVAGILLNDYNVTNALNLDGGGSTAMAMQDPLSHAYSMVNTSSDPTRTEGSNFAVFSAAPEPASLATLVLGVLILGGISLAGRGQR
jgi:hypothetical protein